MGKPDIRHGVVWVVDSVNPRQQPRDGVPAGGSFGATEEWALGTLDPQALLVEARELRWEPRGMRLTC